tara:strand:+ start:149 stop:295 length:147 start_codon:yes stop_codon:yes gene_type:complete
LYLIRKKVRNINTIFSFGKNIPNIAFDKEKPGEPIRSKTIVKAKDETK